MTATDERPYELGRRLSDRLREVLQPKVADVMVATLGTSWVSSAAKGGGKPSDLQFLLKVLRQHHAAFWRGSSTFNDSIVGRAAVLDLISYRNRLSHFDEADPFLISDAVIFTGRAESLLQSLHLPVSEAFVKAADEVRFGHADLTFKSDDLSAALLAALQSIQSTNVIPLSFDGRSVATPAQVLQLPPWDSTFVGRKEVINDLLDLLSPNNRVAYIIIDGPGGIGKSATAAQAIYQMMQSGATPYDRILWLTAKDTELTATEKRHLPPDFKNLHDLLARICRLCNLNLPNEAGSPTTADLLHAAVAMLSTNRVLLVVDNLETVEGSEIHSFLESRLPYPSKALVTSRVRRWVGSRVQVRGLSAEDVQILVGDLFRIRTGRPVTVPPHLADQLVEWSGGVPLAIRWLVASTGYQIDNLTTTISAPADRFDEALLEFCFENLAKSLSSLDKRVLVLLSLLPSPMSRERLVRILQVQPSEASASIERLEECSLVIAEDDGYRYTVLPLTRRFVRLLSEAWTSENESQFAQQALEAYVREITERYGNEPPSAPFLEQELDNLSFAFEYCSSHRLWSSVMHLARAVSEHLGFVGNNEARLYFGRTAAKAALQMGDKSSHEWFLAFDVAWVLLHTGQLDEAESIWNSILADNRSADVRVRAMSLKNLALVERMQAELSTVDVEEKLMKAAQLAEASIALWESIGDQHWATTTRGTLATIHLDQGQFDSAYADYVEIRVVHESNRHDEGVAITCSNMARVLIRQGNYDEAESLLDISEQIDRRLGRKQGLAAHFERRGDIAIARRDVTLALQNYQASADLHKEIGSLIRLRRVEEKIGKFTE